MSEKTIKDRISNLLLSIYIIKKVNQVAKLEDNLKLQKLIFLSQKLLNERQRRGLSYLFLRWNKGPFSTNVNEDLTLLKNSKFVNWGTNQIDLTEEGEKFFDTVKEVYVANETCLKYVDKIIDEYSHLSPDRIKEEVYNMRMWIPRVKKVMRVEEVPMKSLLMYPISEEKAKYSFNVPNDWLETLEVIFDKEAMDLLKKAEHDAKEGRVSTRSKMLNAL